jgi:NADPH:quinone reductase-like Zn-dependent oxidoreductase
MRAVVHERYGDIDGLRVREVDVPTIGDDQVLVRIHAASMHADIWHTVTGLPSVLRVMGGGLRRPKEPIPGTDMAGVVESVGSSVTRFAPGDEVYGETVTWNLWRNGGTYAEYVAVAETLLQPKPARLSFEEAAAVPTSTTIALRALHVEGDLHAGQHVLINGAGGSVGIFAVQIAKAGGAHVVAVDDATKLELLRTIGADAVVDYRTRDITRGDDRYDLVLDIASVRSFDEWRRILRDEGRYVMIGHDHYGATGHPWFGSLGTFAKLLLRTPFTKQLPPPAFSSRDQEPPLVVISRLIDDGAITPVIDRTYPLEQVREALRYLTTGNPRGKIVLTV